MDGWMDGWGRVEVWTGRETQKGAEKMMNERLRRMAEAS